MLDVRGRLCAALATVPRFLAVRAKRLDTGRAQDSGTLPPIKGNNATKAAVCSRAVLDLRVCV
jgi:hypothetical protein